MARIGKKLRQRRERIDKQQLYALPEAIALLREGQSTTFDETIDIAMNLGIDPRHADQQVRGMVSLPKGSGKVCRVAVFAKDSRADEAKDAGADIVGSDDLAEKIQGGFLDFDVCIASPDLMPVIGKLGRILGPHNLMPNPKLGTVTPNVADAVRKAKSGQVQFRAEKEGIVHALVGKASFSPEDLQANIVAFASAVIAAKPSGAKGQYLRRVTLSSTQGPSIRVDAATLQ